MTDTRCCLLWSIACNKMCTIKTINDCAIDAGQSIVIDVVLVIKNIISSTVYIVLITDHQPLFQIRITLLVESASFVPSTSFCSLSSWFTSYCAHHFYHSPNHLRTYCLSLPRPFTRTTLKTHLFHKSFSP